MSEWTEYLLEDVIDTFIDYRGKTPKKSDSGIPLVTAKVVKSGKILTPNEFIPEDEYENWMTRGYPKKNDVVLTTEAPLGEVALIKDENIALAQRIITMRGNPDVVSNVFLKYYFQSDQGQYELDSRASGTTVFGIKASVLRQVPVLLPELVEQRAIAEVLSSLDDKIDLLHRQNQTLEQMAETLFRQWFVEEADEGWEEGVITDYAEHSKVSIKPSANPLSVYAHYSIPGFDAGKEPIHELGQEIKSNKYQVCTNAILFSKLNPHKDKRVWLILDKVPENAICSTEFQVIKPHDENHLYFLYGWLSNSANYREISSGVGGTSGSHQRISPSEIFSFPTPKVSDELLNDYADTIKPIFKKQQSNQSQISTLTVLRDSLLPKLMSGEIRIV